MRMQRQKQPRRSKSAEQRTTPVPPVGTPGRPAGAEPAEGDGEERRRGAVEERVRALVELVPDATVVTDRDGYITLVNHQTELLFGYPGADLVGQSVEVLLPAHFHEIHRAHRAEYVAAPRIRPMGANLRLVGRRRDGSEFPIDVSLSPLAADDDARAFRVISTIRDLSERVHVEAARAAAEAASAELRRLQAITDVALAHLSLEELLHALLTRLREVMAVDNVAILLLSGEGEGGEEPQELILYAAQGPEAPAVDQVHVPIGQGIAGHIAATRQPLIVDDLATVEVVNPVLREHVRSLVGVPLLVEDRLLGVVHAGSTMLRRFTEEDARLLQLVGERIAWAIERARLYAAEQTARQDVEAALARAQVSETRFRRLLESNIIGLAVVDAEQVIEANDAMLEIVGASRETLEAGRLRWQEMTAREYAEATARAIKETLVEGACQPFETAYVRPDGSRVSALVGSVLLERDPPSFVAFVVDLTERKWLEREWEEARARELAVREVNRQLDEFFATAAHDIRGPVAATKGQAQLALHRFEDLLASVAPAMGAAAASSGAGAGMGEQRADDLTSQWEAVHESLVETNQSADQLVRLVVRLFDVARARTGTLELQLDHCDLAMLVRAHVAAQRAALPGRPIGLDLPNGAQPVWVLADADRLGQVLTNYLTNALKYSPANRPVEVRLEMAEGRAVVAVRDEGPGLPWEEQSRIWELFHRAPGVEVQSDAGSGGGSLGLGLHICKRIVELHHGGRIGIESEVGVGATFWFSLPLDAGTAAAMNTAAGAPVP
jgi:PAS domain S-box-containing protein